MSDAPIASAPETPPDRMGLFARLIGIFTSPSAVLRSVTAHPSWILVVLVVGIAIGAIQFALMSTEVGETVLRESIEERVRGSNVTLTDQQMQQQLTIARYAGPVAAVVFSPLFALFSALIVYLVFNVFMGEESSFKQVLAVASHVYPIGILQVALATLLVYLKGSAQATTSFGALLPFAEPGTFLYYVFRGIDIFYIWQLGVLALGLSILYRKPVGRYAKVLFGIYIVLVVGIAALIPALSG